MQRGVDTFFPFEAFARKYLESKIKEFFVKEADAKPGVTVLPNPIAPPLPPLPSRQAETQSPGDNILVTPPATPLDPGPFSLPPNEAPRFDNAPHITPQEQPSFGENIIYKDRQEGDSGREKFTPNPNGRKGGEEHQAEIDRLERDIRARGLIPQREFMDPDGEKTKRFIDIIARDKDGNVVERYQVGRGTKSGDPVARERRSMDDTQAVEGERPTFVPYNLPK